nr:zinc finger protein 391-like [Pogona vitticeps]
MIGNGTPVRDGATGRASSRLPSLSGGIDTPSGPSDQTPEDVEGVVVRSSEEEEEEEEEEWVLLDPGQRAMRGREATEEPYGDQASKSETGSPGHQAGGLSSSEKDKEEEGPFLESAEEEGRSTASGREKKKMRKEERKKGEGGKKPGSGPFPEAAHVDGLPALRECHEGHKMVIQKRKKALKSSDCEKSFIQQLYLTKHGKNIHAGAKLYTCSECGKGFNYRTNLKVHQRVHTGEKPYECSECGKTFSRSTNLKSHLRIHAREMPYECSECEKKFGNLTKFKWHQRVHQKKLFPCLDCPKGFASSTELKAHQRIHTGEKIHQCFECGKGFSHSVTLKIHQRTAHRGKTASDSVTDLVSTSDPPES